VKETAGDEIGSAKQKEMMVVKEKERVHGIVLSHQPRRRMKRSLKSHGNCRRAMLVGAL
jgi:hypothetical protein